ncbi:MAG: DUF4124 domain-containing protein [Nitrosomonadales bacterium]|nr:DUF4124 domain-containing protein [Nitrosomonadales bacterium]
MTKSRLLIALIAGLTFCLPASAKMYKWVDDNGVTHYGETIPPQYANKDRAVLEKGRVVKKQEVLTAEERRAKEEADKQERIEKEAAIDRKRHDKALINTYSNVNEIDLARSRNLQQVDARISSINSQIRMSSDSLGGLQKEADGRKKSGKAVPPSLLDDIQSTQERLENLQQELGNANAEKDTLNARYDTDKARYKELTGK